jgi:hypothetical protein
LSDEVGRDVPSSEAFCCTYGCTDLFRVSEIGEAL